MRGLDYPFVLEQGPEGDFALTFPDVPEAITGGFTRDEALSRAQDCLSTALTFYIQEGRPCPTPGKPKRGQATIGPYLQIALKAAVNDALRESGRRPADLARLLDTDHKSALRILNPDHATKIATLEQALDVLGKRIMVATEDKAA